MRVVHGREEVRLLHHQARRVGLEEGDVVLEDQTRGQLGATAYGVANDGVHGVALRHRLLHEVPLLERGDRRRGVGARAQARELRERCEIDTVSLDVREHPEHPARLRRETLPRPRHQERHLGEVVLVIDDAHRLDAVRVEERRDLGDRRRT